MTESEVNFVELKGKPFIYHTNHKLLNDFQYKLNFESKPKVNSDLEP